MKYLVLALCLFMTQACADDNNRDEPKLEDPAKVHPPEEAVPDSMTIHKDSVIVPDSTGRNRSTQ